jgi:deoxycytidylate deaminase
MPDPHYPRFMQQWEAAAVSAGMHSTCAKSRRGVAIVSQWGRIIGYGWNGPPPPFACQGDGRCRDSCNKIAVHAEDRALRSVDRYNSVGTELIHVKIVDGLAVPSGPPSCWQCSRSILDAGIAGIWLMHDEGWYRYLAEKFHALTLRHHGLPTETSP